MVTDLLEKHADLAAELQPAHEEKCSACNPAAADENIQLGDELYLKAIANPTTASTLPALLDSNLWPVFPEEYKHPIDMFNLPPEEKREMRRKLIVQALELLETHGWVKGTMGGPGRGYCALGACVAAARMKNVLFDVSDMFWKEPVPGSGFGVTSFNDMLTTSYSDVKNYLRSLAE